MSTGERIRLGRVTNLVLTSSGSNHQIFAEHVDESSIDCGPDVIELGDKSMF